MHPARLAHKTDKPPWRSSWNMLQLASTFNETPNEKSLKRGNEAWKGNPGRKSKIESISCWNASSHRTRGSGSFTLTRWHRCIAPPGQEEVSVQDLQLLQVVPGRAGGGSFKRKQNHIAEKEFAYRMCANFFWVWTKLLPLHGGDVMWFGVMCLWFDFLSSSDVASCEVICGTTPVLLCTRKTYNVLLQYYSSTTPTCYSVLQRTTPGLLCTTKYYSLLQSITPVLLQYYSVLQSTTLYYKVLLQYHSVPQSTTPVLLWTTPVLERTSPTGTALKRHLQCAAQQESPSNFTKYCACHAKWMSSMICVTYETSFPMRGASKVTLQHHQLRLPRKMNVINDLRHIWNVISNAWSK